MSFNSVQFLVFMTIMVAGYFVIPLRLRYVWLLIGSYTFYMCAEPVYGLIMFLSTLISYAGAILMEKQKKYLVPVIILDMLPLLFFKYTDFLLDTADGVFSLAGGSLSARLNIILPVGISFYTFQTMGYVIDVYRKRLKAERNIFHYALYVSFFPQLVAGPIERSVNLLPQIKDIGRKRNFDPERIRDGVMLILWGLFQKMVIADRLSITVDYVFDHWKEYGYGGLEMAVATTLFAFQIYMDFGGYTAIARGCARIFGIELMQNFRQPYLATSIKDFWRRWHISLTSWFTDYLYIPLGGSRKGKGRKYLNVLIVFGLSGLWHGAAWHFVVWGLLHALYRCAGDAIEDRKKKEEGPVAKLFNMGVTFCFVVFAWLFFRAGSLKQAFGMILQGIRTPHFNGWGWGQDRAQIVIALVALLIVALVDILHEKEIAVYGKLKNSLLPFRWVCFAGLLFTVFLFGVYGRDFDVAQFIYFRF